MAKKQEIGVIGLGKFGYPLAETLVDLGHDVVAIDQDESKIRLVRKIVAQVYEADATDRGALEQLGFKDLDYVVVSIGSSMEASILVALNLLELNVPQVWVKAISSQHETILKRLGVHRVVFPEQYVARQMAHHMAVPGILDYLPLGKGMLVREITVNQWSEQSLRDLNLTNNYGVQVAAVKPKGRTEFNFVPRADRPLEKGDVLILLGQAENVSKITNQEEK